MRKAIGIMQGRLVPPPQNTIQAFPVGRWAEEFPKAADAGLASLEWIHDGLSVGKNPLESPSGICQMRTLAESNGIAVRSLCADYFIEYPLLRVGESDREARLRHLAWLLEQCNAAGIRRVVLPFVDHSAIHTQAEERDIAGALHHILPIALRFDIELHLETSLGPERFAALLEQVPSPLVKVNYDSGNSASCGYNPRDEFAAYGRRIGSVHIKDRVQGGPTVPLGTGDVDFPGLFTGLAMLRYAGDFILQVARGEPGDELEWARRNRAFVEQFLD